MYTHLVAHSCVGAKAAHARPAPAAVVPSENEVERAGADHATRGHRVWHPQLVVLHLDSGIVTMQHTEKTAAT